jgi:hypothetical protein
MDEVDAMSARHRVALGTLAGVGVTIPPKFHVTEMSAGVLAALMAWLVVAVQNGRGD